MAIRGEYWITEDGSSWYADGDVGMINHEGHVLDTARRRVLDLLGLDCDHDFVDDETFFGQLHDFVRAEIGPAWAERPGRPAAELPALLRKNIEENSSDPKEVAEFDGLWSAANDATDLRDFAMQAWGWIWVRGDNCAVQSLDADTRKRLHAGLGEILDQEGFEPEEADDHEVQVAVRANGRHFSFRVGDIPNATLVDQTVEPNHEAATRIARNQVAQMDRALAHPYYRDRELGGD